VLEQAGIATVMLPSNRALAERMRPPRALFCDFPLGRPLGKPRDAAFQRRVLMAGFELLARPAGPVLEDYPEAIHDDATPVVCAIPPRFDASLHPAVDEALALRPAWRRAYERTGKTQVGRAFPPEQIGEAVQCLLTLSGEVEQLAAAAMDIRTYYEEAALGLLDHVPAAHSAESWLFGETETGRLLVALARGSETPARLRGRLVPAGWLHAE
jgi:hypothetical protein